MPRLRPLLATCASAVALAATGCGEQIEVAADDPLREGANLFNQRCSGCHTLEAAASAGSKPRGQISGGERTNGPNFDTRIETAEDVLYAIRNGGFSGAIMPANIVVGEDAEAVAAFVEQYAGQDISADEDAATSGPGGGDAGGATLGN